MITDDIIKMQFITKVVNEDMIAIRQAQKRIFYENVYAVGKDLVKQTRKGRTLAQGSHADIENYLNSAPASIVSTATGAISLQEMPITLRFLDMKKKGDWRIYNAQLWGILYNNSLRRIRYETGEAISEQTAKLLQDTFNP